MATDTTKELTQLRRKNKRLLKLVRAIVDNRERIFIPENLAILNPEALWRWTERAQKELR